MKNHLFIGLGGQGGKSISELQKVFLNRTEDAKAMKDSGQKWDFLYIDSSRDVTNERRNWVHFGQDLKLKPSSFLYLKDDGVSIDARAMAQRPDVARWIGEVERLQAFLEGTQGIQGANQRRRLGRLLFARNADRIRKAVCEDKITPMLSSAYQCAIHIFASLAGGTGSGGIVDLLTMLRTEYTNANVETGFPVFLYLYITDRDFEEAKAGYFHENQCAALRDINALCCGKFRPNLLGSAGGANRFSGDEPVTQIILSSHLSNKNQMLSLSQQHQIVAEAAFERIYSYVSGHLDTIQQKAVTGEDGLANWPGEPTGNLQRSFRFGSVGMRRWEVPIEEVRELLACDLLAASYRKLLYHNWSETMGFVGEKLASAIPGYTEALSELSSIVDAERISNTELPVLIEALNSDFSRVNSGKMREGFKDLDLSTYEDELRQRYTSALNDQGVDSVFRGFTASRDDRVKRIKDRIHGVIRNAWTRKDQALGLGYVHDLLIDLQEKVRQAASNDVVASVGNDAIRRRMDMRKAEWLKMTLLSRPFKQEALALAQLEDLSSILRDDLRKRAKKEDVELMNLAIGILGQLASDYQLASGKMQEWCGDIEKRRDQLHRDLTQLRRDPGQGQESVVANKAELSMENLETHIKDQRLEASLIRNTCDELLDRSILGTLGSDQIPRLGRLTDDQRIQLRESAESILFKRVEQIHDSIRGRTHRDSVITGNVLDIVQKRHGEDPERFNVELLAFINSASCNLALSTSELQPKALRQDPRMRSMPRAGLVIGLPNGHPFGPKFAEMVKPLLDAGNTAVQGVYYHDDPTQIRMLSVTYWMAARFSTCIHRLETMYRDALASDYDGDTKYFTNIDSSGEAGQRPSLLLPPPGELQLAMLSTLWLGTRMTAPGGGGMLIQESNGQVVLVQQTEDGIEPKIIGESIEALGKVADIVTICQVSDAVSAMVSSMDDEQAELLRNQLEKDDAARLEKNGAASQQYIAWVEQRKIIQNHLKR
jgi:hypothetical protein